MFTAMITLLPSAHPSDAGANLHLASRPGGGAAFDTHLEAACCSGTGGEVTSPVVLPTSPEAFLARLEENIAVLARRLEKIMDRVGADPGWAVRLHVGPDGKIGVMGETPFRMQVQQAIDNDPELQGLIRSIVGDAGLWSAHQEALAFRKDYEQDPRQALAVHGPALGRKPVGMTLLLFQGGEGRVEGAGGERVAEVSRKGDPAAAPGAGGVVVHQ